MSKTIWAAMVNRDLTEGRGPLVPDSFWETKAMAETASSCLVGVQGGRNTAGIKEYTLYENLNEHPEVLRNKQKEKEFIADKLADLLQNKSDLEDRIRELESSESARDTSDE